MPMMTHQDAKRVRVNYVERRSTWGVKNLDNNNAYNDQSLEESELSESYRNQTHSSNN